MEQKCLFVQGDKSCVTCKTDNTDFDDTLEFSKF